MPRFPKLMISEIRGSRLYFLQNSCSLLKTQKNLFPPPLPISRILSTLALFHLLFPPGGGGGIKYEFSIPPRFNFPFPIWLCTLYSVGEGRGCYDQLGIKAFPQLSIA